MSWAMRKLGVEEWLVSAVISMYTGAKTVFRTVYGNSKGFEVKVGTHQGSALNPLLFVIVMEAISREFRVALLYVDDLAVIAETEEELIKRLNEWKDNTDSKDMRLNINKTKVMISGERQKVRQKAVRWPCGVCRTGVGSHSLQCTSCQKWVHRNTHTHPFNGPFSGTTQVSRYQKGKTNLDFTEARDNEWQWHQLDHMHVCISLQTDNHANTPPLSFLQAGCTSCRPANSVKALKAQGTQEMQWYCRKWRSHSFVEVA